MMRLGSAKLKATPEAANDPRETGEAEVIDLATRQSLPQVAKKGGASDGLQLFAGVAIVASLGAAAFLGMNSGRDAQEEVAPVEAAPAVETVPVATTPVTTTPVPVTPVGTSPAPITSPQPVFARTVPQPNTVTAVNPYSSPTVVFDGGGQPVAVSSPGAQPAAAGARPTTGSVTGSAGDFASAVGGVGGGPASAVATFDPKTTVTQGTLIPAVLETAIDTDVPGFVRAVVSQDVRSYDGTRVLVPRSSRLIGQYQSGLQAGQKRAYVIWTRLIRPDGVSVDIASPATGFDGSGGLPGKVDNHFFQRFGSAMLLSVIGGLSTLATGGSSVILGGGSSAASTALQQDGNIPPTVRVKMGEPIRVFTARDLDFSSVQ
ncbi:TrbI/VirB10 family protein [Pseudoblastomonas flavescens]|uniref:TrbI/VirB10 family protein n=1 Tax=Alteriqipengyuania flavescens TaxID=3053610 RepID=UPI00299F8C60|nr:TrbI/VirB10 family protein [Alteriqipengyuania flavescens]